MRLIGITGGVGAGKSEILDFISKHYKCKIYLADQVAHELKEPGQICYNQLVELMGEGILGEDGRIDRSIMASYIFIDNSLLQKVNELVHPAVQNYLLNKIEEAQNNPEIELFFVEAALLIEAGYKDILDEIWYIYANETEREKRLRKSRGYTPEKIANIMEKQLSEEAFRNACDFVIDNSGSLMDSYKKIEQKLEAFTWRD